MKTAMKTLFRPRLAVLAAGALLSLSAHAHHPWLVPSATVADGPSPSVSIYAAVSEDLFEFDSFPLNLDALVVTAPDGSTVAPDARVDAKRLVTFELKLAQKGTYRVAGTSDTAMATWKVGDEMKRWRGASSALAKEVPADAQDLQVSHQFSRVETFVTNDAGGPLSPVVSGQGIELVPLTSPTDLSVGDTTRFRLLLDGKPWPDANLTLLRGGNRYRYKLGEIAIKTDAAGEFAIAWPEAGRYWLGANHGGRGGPEGGSPGGPGGPGAGDHAGGAGQRPAPTKAAGPAGNGRRESYTATFEVLPK